MQIQMLFLHVKSGTTTFVNSLFIHKTTGNIGIRTLNPSWMFHMTNGGTSVGANSSMAEFENTGNTGQSLSAWNSSNSNPSQAFESTTDYIGTAYLGIAISGLAQNSSASINAVTIG